MDDCNGYGTLYGMPITRHCIAVNGKVWRLHTGSTLAGKNVGMCYYNLKTIKIARGQEPLAYFDTLVHELLHAHFPDLTEEQVTRKASEMVHAMLLAGIYPLPED